MRILTLFIIVIRNIEMAIRDLFGSKFRPYKLLLELTDYCNSKCKTCYIWKNNGQTKSEISTEDLRSTLKNYGSNLLWIALGGGEVTLYTEFDQLLEDFKTYCPKLRILTFTTNALKPEKVLEFAKKIKAQGYDLFITISLDGDEETHDLIRNVSGNYKKAQQARQLLIEHKIWNHFGLTVSQFNSQYINHGVENNIDTIRAFSFEHTGGIYKTNLEISNNIIISGIQKIISIYKVKKISELVERVYLVLAESFFAQNKTALPVPCEVIASSLHIRPNGDIKPCMYLPKIGNIKNDQMHEILGSELTKNLAKKARAGECERCWMNCYAPHSIMRHPFIAMKKYLLSKSYSIH